MISREDFIFTIGFDGSSAVVDGAAKRAYGKLTTAELAEKGLFRAAVSSALLSKNPNEIDVVIKAYNAKAKTAYSNVDELKRLFGISEEGVKKALSLG